MKWNIPEALPEWKTLWDRYKYILLVILAGVLLLLLPERAQDPEGEARYVQQAELFDLEEMEKKLEGILGQVQGAGEVTVMLTLRESDRQVLARDTEHSGSEQRSTAVIVSQGSGVQQTVSVQSIYPKYQGALVVCSGGGDARVKLELLQAVRALTGLSAEKISICKRQ